MAHLEDVVQEGAMMLETPYPLPVDFLGPPLEEGPLPAFLYFSVCAHESLYLAPYHSPTIHCDHTKMRTFSFTIPGHGPSCDKFKALEWWASEFKAGRDPLAPFFDQCVETLHWLQMQGWLSLNSLAIGGLSRGAFVATHLAARLPEVRTVLGFAPLTRLSTIKVFQENEYDYSRYDLETLLPKLMHIENFRFYIGNYDTLVNTEICFLFIRKFTTYAVEHRVRACSPELFILKAIGKDGHGTSPETFQQGAQWIQSHLNVQ